VFRQGFILIQIKAVDFINVLKLVNNDSLLIIPFEKQYLEGSLEIVRHSGTRLFNEIQDFLNGLSRDEKYFLKW